MQLVQFRGPPTTLIEEQTLPDKFEIVKITVKELNPFVTAIN